MICRDNGANSCTSQILLPNIWPRENEQFPDRGPEGDFCSRSVMGIVPHERTGADLKNSPRRVPLRRRSARTRRRLILVAGAAAVVLVLAVVMVGFGFGFIGGASAPTGPTALMTPSAGNNLPRYYVVPFQHYTNAGHTIGIYAVVHDTETGAALATVRVPRLIPDD